MMSSSNTKPAATTITKKTVFSAQEALFTKQIDFLNQASYLNLTKLGNEELCRQNQHNIRELTNKKPIKLSSELKYFYCKKCEIMLIPGKTCRIRVKSRREPHVVSTCLNCENLKRYNLVANRNKKDRQTKKENTKNKNTKNTKTKDTKDSKSESEKK